MCSHFLTPPASNNGVLLEPPCFLRERSQNVPFSPAYLIMVTFLRGGNASFSWENFQPTILGNSYLTGMVVLRCMNYLAEGSSSKLSYWLNYLLVEWRNCQDEFLWPMTCKMPCSKDDYNCLFLPENTGIYSRLMTQAYAKLAQSQTDMTDREIKPITYAKLNMFHTDRS